jgi:hypothetical protein
MATHVFYDVKTRTKVERPVQEKVTYGDENRKRYAFKGTTEDGRKLTAFVSKDKWDGTTV